MGRELKRVALDFQWPENQVWQGYLNPHYAKLHDSPEDEQEADSRIAVEPPAGDGYQIWETVSEGSPISPVFATPEELARHMAGRPWGADKGSSYDAWMRFINGPGWAPSMVSDSDGVRVGPNAVP